MKREEHPVTADEVIQRCASLGVQLASRDLAEHIAALCNEPVTFPEVPPPPPRSELADFILATMACKYRSFIRGERD